METKRTTKKKKNHSSENGSKKRVDEKRLKVRGENTPERGRHDAVPREEKKTQNQIRIDTRCAPTRRGNQIYYPAGFETKKRGGITKKLTLKKKLWRGSAGGKVKGLKENGSSNLVNTNTSKGAAKGRGTRESHITSGEQF